MANLSHSEATPDTKQPAPHVVPRVTEGELASFVQDMIAQRLITSAQIPPDDWQMTFMPLVFGAFEGWTEEELGQMGVLYEYLDKAGPRSVNGLPSFFSFRMLHKDDWAVALERFNKARMAVEGVAHGRK